MSARVNHGPCGQCGAPVLYLGAEFCSPRCHQAHAAPRPMCELCNRFPQEDEFTRQCVGCNVTPPVLSCELCKRWSETKICAQCSVLVPAESREVFVLDTETALMVPGCMAPPLACVGWCTSETYGLLHHSESKPTVVSVLEGDQLVVGHHVAFDMAVFCANWPDVIPLVFDAYEKNRITDTLIREKLVDIAVGGRAFKYNLDEVSRKRLGVAVDKKDEWRLRFGELIPYSLEQWPQAAKDYAQKDPVITFGIYQEQEKDRQWLADQFRQAQYAFWLELMSVWGLHTDEKGVREFSSKIQKRYDDISAELIAVGLIRWEGKKNPKLVRDTKAVRVRMEQAWAVRKGDEEPHRTKTGISTNADNCDRSGDPLLEKYAEISSLTTIKSTYIPLIQQGVHTPIHTTFDSLKATGRTGSGGNEEGEGGNTQNLPTEMGVRECFVPRPGYCWAIADYGSMELHTWAQLCVALFGRSDMANALNSGVDPHTKMASLMLNISYEEAVADYAADRKGRIYSPRQSAKVCNFGFPGGLGYKRMVDFARSNYGVVFDPDPTRATEIAKGLKRYWRQAWGEADLYANWIAAQGESGRIMIQQLFVGRFRGRLSYTAASNTGFQGLAADCAKRAGFLIAKACYVEQNSPLFGCRPAIFAHDEFGLEIPIDPWMHERAMELSRLMKTGADIYLPDCPSVVEPLLAWRWSKSAKPVFEPCRTCGAQEKKSCVGMGEHVHEGRRLTPWDWEKK